MLAAGALAHSPFVGADGLAARPDSPAAAEGRLKKYRRGGDAELAARMAMGSKMMFPSLHTSIDEEDMPNVP